MAPPLRILHCRARDSRNGQSRAARLIEAFGAAAEHFLLGTERDSGGANRLDGPSPRPGWDLLRFWRLSRCLRSFDLVLTYGPGTLGAAMASRLFGGPPLIHHEDGCEDARGTYRRLALGGVDRLIVPSRELEREAVRDWGMAPERVVRIPDGVRVALFSRPPEEGAIPGFARRPGEIVIGSVADLRPAANLTRLARAVAGMTNRNARLVIVGSGPESERIAGEAGRCGLADRLLMPGPLAEAERWLGHFDIFAMSSDRECLPIRLVEAMAAGLPVVATSVGDVPSMIADDNRPLIVDPSDEAAFSAALDSLADQPNLRRAIGTANRAKAAAAFDETKMIATYARVYGEVIGRSGAFA